MSAAFRGVSCLVHEATFDDSHREDALAKRHSTVQEALGVASDVGARTCVLTHFSQRYPRLPSLAGHSGAAGPHTVLAFDGESVPLQQPPRLPLLGHHALWIALALGGSSSFVEAFGVPEPRPQPGADAEGEGVEDAAEDLAGSRSPGSDAQRRSSCQAGRSTEPSRDGDENDDDDGETCAACGGDEDGSAWEEAAVPDTHGSHVRFDASASDTETGSDSEPGTERRSPSAAVPETGSDASGARPAPPVPGDVARQSTEGGGAADPSVEGESEAPDSRAAKTDKAPHGGRARAKRVGAQRGGRGRGRGQSRSRKRPRTVGSPRFAVADRAAAFLHATSVLEHMTEEP